MFGAKKTKKAPETLQAPEVIDVSHDELKEEVQPRDLEAYLAVAQDNIQRSATLWREDIADAVRPVQSDTSLSVISQEIQRVYGASINPGKAASVARNFLDHMVKHALITARYMSIEGVKIKIPEDEDPEEAYIMIIGKITEIKDEDTRRVLYGTNPPRILTSEGQADLIADMRSADQHRERAIDLLVDFHQDNDNLFEEVDTALRQEDGREELSELQKMISYDWNVSKENGCLRQYLEWLKGDVGRHIDSFIQEISDDGSDVEEFIKEYVRFTLQYIGEEASLQNITKIIEKTYEQDGWDSMPELKKGFEKFVEERISKFEHSLVSIAGAFSRKDIRNARTLDEVCDSQLSMVIDCGSGRARRLKRKNKRLPKQSIELPEEKEVADKEKAPRQLAKVQRIDSSEMTQDNARLVFVSEDEMLESLKIKFQDGNGLEADIRKMIQYLQRNPVNPASKRLQTADKHCLRVNGHLHFPFRFAPHHAAGIGKIRHKDFRIVYVVAEDSVAILDILSHEEFDKKY